MRYISLLIPLLFLASCSSTATAVQAAAIPYHLIAVTEGAITIDANVAGLGLCASADVEVGVHRVDGVSSQPLGEWGHDGQAGAVAYEFERGDDGWAAYQLNPDVGAERYPLPFERCALSPESKPAALHSSPAGRVRKWRETSAPASEQ